MFYKIICINFVTCWQILFLSFFMCSKGLYIFMQIQQINKFSTVPLLLSKKPKSKKTEKTQDYQTSPMREDSFTPESKEFNLEKSLKALSYIKDKNGKDKFHKGQLSTLEYYLKEEPKKWNSGFAAIK